MFELIKKLFLSVFAAVGRGGKFLVKFFRIKQVRDILGQTFHMDQRLVFGLRGRKMPSLKQFKYLFHLLNRTERLALLIFSAIFLLSGGFLGAKTYFDHRVFVPAYGGEYFEALIGSPRNVSPIYAYANPVDADIVRLVFSGLLRYDGRGSIVPDIADSYALSPDLKTYTFKLRQDVRFQDGSPLTADDVVFTFSIIQDESWKSPLSASLAGIKIEKLGDYEVSFVLDEPFMPFLEVLTTGILPKHLWEGIRPSSGRLAEINLKPVGSGPFKFSSFVRSKDGAFRSYSLERNDQFYGRKPYLDRVVFHFYQSYEEAADALKSHTVSGVVYFSKGGQQGTSGKGEAGELGDLDKNPEVEYYKLKLPQYNALFFNVRNNDILADQKVRKAIALSLDKEKIWSEATGKEGSVLNAPIPEGFLGYEPQVKTIPFDPVAGAELLESAGWKMKTSTSTVRSKKDANLSFRLLTLDRAEYLKAGSVIVDNLKNVGIEVDLQAVSSSELQRDIIRPRNYDALLYGEVLGLDPDLYPFWHSSQADEPGLNLSGFLNREADKLLEDARKLGSAEERSVRYRAFQAILADELPAIFLYTPNYIYPQRKTIKGFDVSVLSVASDRFANITDWYTKTKRSFR